jgi:hypothetical protein
MKCAWVAILQKIFPPEFGGRRSHTPRKFKILENFPECNLMIENCSVIIKWENIESQIVGIMVCLWRCVTASGTFLTKVGVLFPRFLEAG